MDVKFFRQIATPQEVTQLREWLLFLRANGDLGMNTSGEYRYYRPLGDLPTHPPVIERLNQEIKKQFGIEGKCVDLRNVAEAKRLQATPSFIGMQVHGGFVHPHIDENIGDMLQFRCTLLINKPMIGGRLMLAGKEYDMEAGDMYCFVSNNTIHGTTLVQGDKPRMACSQGFIVDKSSKLDAAPAPV